jgi:hypothetical protein
MHLWDDTLGKQNRITMSSKVIPFFQSEEHIAMKIGRILKFHTHLSILLKTGACVHLLATLVQLIRELKSDWKDHFSIEYQNNRSHFDVRCWSDGYCGLVISSSL